MMMNDEADPCSRGFTSAFRDHSAADIGAGIKVERVECLMYLQSLALTRAIGVNTGNSTVGTVLVKAIVRWARFLSRQ